MDNGSLFIQQLINGLSLGSIYALIALGYTMVYGIVKLINFAHGDILMIGAYAGYFILRWLGTTPVGMVFAFIFAMIVCATVAILMERFAYRPLRQAPRLNSLITAIAISLILQNGVRVLPFIGPNHRQYPTMETVNISFGLFFYFKYSVSCYFAFCCFDVDFELYYQLHKNRKSNACCFF